MVNYEIPGNMVKFKILDDMVECGILITEWILIFHMIGLMFEISGDKVNFKIFDNKVKMWRFLMIGLESNHPGLYSILTRQLLNHYHHHIIFPIIY
jgi:hypothetical protein